MNTRLRPGSTKLFVRILIVAIGVMPVVASAQTDIILIDSSRGSKLLRSAQSQLRQRAAPGLRLRQDAFADSLVAFILSPPPSANRSDDAYSMALTLAAAGIGGIKNPYLGAAERLETIALKSTDRRVAVAAISGLAYSADTTRAIQALRQVSISGVRHSYSAIQHLGTNFGTDGIAVLRELYQEGLVQEHSARKILDGYAFQFGWSKR